MQKFSKTSLPLANFFIVAVKFSSDNQTQSSSTIKQYDCPLYLIIKSYPTPIRDKIAISCMLRQIHEFSSHAIRHGLYIKNRKRLFCPQNNVSCFVSSMQYPCNAFGLLSKKQYAPNAEIRFMIKLLTDLWHECTICAVFFSMSLMGSIMYLLRSIILSQNGISLIFMFTRNPVTSCIPSSKRKSNSFCEIQSLSANNLPYKRLVLYKFFIISHKPKVCFVKVNINLSKTNQARNHRC